MIQTVSNSGSPARETAVSARQAVLLGTAGGSVLGAGCGLLFSALTKFDLTAGASCGAIMGGCILGAAFSGESQP